MMASSFFVSCNLRLELARHTLTFSNPFFFQQKLGRLWLFCYQIYQNGYFWFMSAFLFTAISQPLLQICQNFNCIDKSKQIKCVKEYTNNKGLRTIKNKIKWNRGSFKGSFHFLKSFSYYFIIIWVRDFNDLQKNLKIVSHS